MRPQQLSHQLRKETAGTAVSLFQTGIINYLPDPPLQIFNSSKVEASSYA